MGAAAIKLHIISAFSSIDFDLGLREWHTLQTVVCLVGGPGDRRGQSSSRAAATASLHCHNGEQPSGVAIIDLARVEPWLGTPLHVSY